MEEQQALMKRMLEIELWSANVFLYHIRKEQKLMRKINRKYRLNEKD